MSGFAILGTLKSPSHLLIPPSFLWNDTVLLHLRNPSSQNNFSFGVCSVLSFCILFFFPQATMGDGDYLTAFHRVLMPVAYEVKLNMVISHPCYSSIL